MAKGYELREGEYVLLSQSEIDDTVGESSRTIDLEEFVSGAQIDPVHYDRTYYLGAGEEGGTPIASCTTR